MICKICKGRMENCFQKKILEKHNVQYYRCSTCGFLCTEEPHWLQEAYHDSMNLTDTGIMQRNFRFVESTANLIYFFFNRSGRYLDYGGGFGIFVRCMRDKGFQFFWYDLFTKNLLARGFEHVDESAKYDLVTTFEAFEHFVDPLSELDKICKYSSNILFSTELISDASSEISEWWYLGTDHGQHVSFYSYQTLETIARMKGLYFYSNGRDLHLFTTRKLSLFIFRLLVDSRVTRWINRYVCKHMPSLIWKDYAFAQAVGK